MGGRPALQSSPGSEFEHSLPRQERRGTIIPCHHNPRNYTDNVLPRAIEQFRNYCGLVKVARSGFPWEKTTKGEVAPPYFLRAELTEGREVRLSSRKAACSSMAPSSST